MPIIDIINESTVVTDVDVAQAAKAIQLQVTNDLPKAWSTGLVTINATPKGTSANPANWWVVLTNNSDVASALGYHELNPQGLPLGKVFPETCSQDGVNWTVDLSHEILEMLVDSFCNTSASDDTGTFYALEICDAVESDACGYNINVDGVAVVVSDFVYPAWFVPGATGQMSFQKNITESFALASGGYISTLPPGATGWGQVYADTIRPPKVGTRREKRARGSASWRKSTPVKV